MSESDLSRAISLGRVAIFLLLPGALAVVPMAVFVVAQLFAFAHGLALAKAIFPAFGVYAVFQITRYILAKFSSDYPRRLATTAATVIETIGKRRWVALGQQLLMGRLATRQPHHRTQHYCIPPHCLLPGRFTADRGSLEGDSSGGCERAVRKMLGAMSSGGSPAQHAQPIPAG